MCRSVADRDPMAMFLEGYIFGFLERQRVAGVLPLKVTTLSMEYDAAESDVPTGLLVELASGKVLRVQTTVVVDSARR
jgi:hypothetical protein